MKTVEWSVLTAGMIGMSALLLSLLAPAMTGAVEGLFARPGCHDLAWAPAGGTCAAFGTD